MTGVLPKSVADILHKNQEYLAILGALAASWIAIKVVLAFTKIIKNFLPRTNLRNLGPWAVVTGATDGIGKGYAFELAQLGFNVVLISRSRQKLNDVAQEIQEEFKVQTKVVEIDFASNETIYDGISDALKDLEIGVLVNNVGMSYSYPEYFHDLPTNQKVIDLITVNITSVSMMTRVVLPGMIKRKKGAIINISSSSGLRPTPLLTQYSASKAYVDVFSRALQEEVRGTGVIVQSVMPFFVATKLSKIRKTSLLVPGPRDYARCALRTVGIQDRTYGCFSHSIQGAVMEAVPSFLFNAYSKRLLGSARARGRAKATKTQ